MAVSAAGVAWLHSVQSRRLFFSRKTEMHSSREATRYVSGQPEILACPWRVGSSVSPPSRSRQRKGSSASVIHACLLHGTYGMYGVQEVKQSDACEVSRSENLRKTNPMMDKTLPATIKGLAKTDGFGICPRFQGSMLPTKHRPWHPEAKTCCSTDTSQPL